MSSHTDRVQCSIDDGIADVRLVRADKHNGFDMAIFDAVSDVLDEISADQEARVVVLSGEGPSFCAGLDLKAFMADPNNAFARLGEYRDGDAENFAQRSCHGWRSLPIPVIAALHGACFGAGMQLALAADLRIAAPDTRLSAREIQFGLIPDLGISQTLPPLVRDDTARELIYTGRVVEAEEATALGLVTKISHEPLAATLKVAAEIAAKSPEATRSAKRLLNEGPSLDTDAGLALEAELQRDLLVRASLLPSPDAYAGEQ